MKMRVVWICIWMELLKYKLSSESWKIRLVIMICQCFQISWHLMNCNSLVSKCSNKDSEEMNVP